MPQLLHDDASLHYELHGSGGEPLLLIQGVGLIGNGWKPQADGLAARHRLLHFDNRGIGESTCPQGRRLSIEQMAGDAEALIRAVGWNACHVVGHSMGGVIAQRLAIAHPGLVRSLTLICTVARGADAVRLTPGVLWTSLRTSVGTKGMRHRTFLGLIFPKDYLATADTETLATELAPLFGHDLAEQPPIAMRQAMALRSHDGARELPGLNPMPALVISATHDCIAPPRYGRRLAELIPRARFVEIPDASHGVTIQKAAEVNRLIEEFVQAHPIGSARGGTA